MAKQFSWSDHDTFGETQVWTQCTFTPPHMTHKREPHRLVILSHRLKNTSYQLFMSVVHFLHHLPPLMVRVWVSTLKACSLDCPVPLLPFLNIYHLKPPITPHNAAILVNSLVSSRPDCCNCLVSSGNAPQTSAAPKLRMRTLSTCSPAAPLAPNNKLHPMQDKAFIFIYLLHQYTCLHNQILVICLSYCKQQDSGVHCWCSPFCISPQQISFQRSTHLLWQFYAGYLSWYNHVLHMGSGLAQRDPDLDPPVVI